MSSIYDSRLDEFLRHRYLVIADIETTGFSSVYDEILEIGAVILDTEEKTLLKDKDGKIRKFDVFIKPATHKKVPAKIVELTGITTNMVQENGIPRNDAILAFSQFIGDLPVVFHNASFDWNRFLNRDFQLCGLQPNNLILCSLRLAKNLYPEDKQHNLEVLTFKFSGKEMQGHHRAWVDCKYTASIVLRLSAELKERSEISAGMETLFDGNLEETETPKVVSIQHAQRWAKHGHNRLYFDTNVGHVCYDFKLGQWSVKQLHKGKQMDIETLSKTIMQIVGAEDIPSLDDLFPLAS